MNFQNSKQVHNHDMTPSSCDFTLLPLMKSKEENEDSQIVIASTQANQDDMENRKIAHCHPTQVSKTSQDQISSHFPEEWEIVTTPTTVEENTTTGVTKTTENDTDTVVILDLLNTLVNQCVELENEKNKKETNDLNQDAMIEEAIAREEDDEVSTPIVLVSDSSSVCSSDNQQHQTQTTCVDNTDVSNEEMKSNSDSALSEITVSDETSNVSFNGKKALKECNENLKTCNPTKHSNSSHFQKVSVCVAGKTSIIFTHDEFSIKENSNDVSKQKKEKSRGKKELISQELWVAFLIDYHELLKQNGKCSQKQLCEEIGITTGTAFRVISLYEKGYIPEYAKKQNSPVYKITTAAYKEFLAKYPIRNIKHNVSQKKSPKGVSSPSLKNKDYEHHCDQIRKSKRQKFWNNQTSVRSTDTKPGQWIFKDQWLSFLITYHQIKHSSNGFYIAQLAKAANLNRSTAKRAIQLYHHGFIPELPKNQRAKDAYKEFIQCKHKHNTKPSAKKNPHPQNKKWIKPTQEIFNTKDGKRVFVVANNIHITLHVKTSIISSAEEGLFLSYEGNDEYWEVPSQGVDLGVYATRASGDLKQPIIFEMRNFLFGWVLQEWSLQTHDNFFWDITDKNGEVHDEANKTLLPKVNEVYEKSSKVKQNVDIDFDNKKQPHYILRGGTKFERGVPKELFTHYGPEYDQVRKRKYSALGDRDRSWVPAYFQISTSIDAYQEKDVDAVLDYFLNFTPTDSEARYRMKWATEKIQRICQEVLYGSGRKLPKATETKIKKVLSLFPRPKSKDDQKTITKNKNVGCMVVRQVEESGTYESGMVEQQLGSGNYVISMTNDLSLKEWNEEEVLRGKK